MSPKRLAAALGLALLAPAAQAGPVIRVLSAPAPLRFHHDRDTAQITAMRESRFPASGMHAPGITVAETELKTDYRMEFERKPGAPAYRVWVVSVDLVFQFSRMDVYISSQYGEGSCPYAQVLAHEKQHVAIDERELARYKALLAAALRRSRLIPSRSHPLLAGSPAEGKALVARRLGSITHPYFVKYQKAAEAANAKIDTLANYRRIQARCKEW